MPVRGTCLMNDTPLKEALFDIVEFTAYERLKAGKNASLSSVYSDIRKAGVEVDLATIGEIYQNVTPRTDANFDSDIDIEDYVGRTFNDAINNLIPAGEDQEGLAITGESQISEQKPERAVVEFLLKALYMDVAEDQRTTSVMKQMQNALWKGMQRKLGKLSGKTAVKQDMKSLIEQSLNWDQMGIADVNGRLNSISDLFGAMKEELAKAVDDIRSASDPAIVDRLNEYVKNLENATYNLMFTDKGAKQVRNEALMNAGFGKQLSNGKMILDWNKLAAGIGSVADIRSNVDKAFLDAGYSQAVTDRLKDTLEQEFYDLRTDIIERQQNKTDQFARSGEKTVMEDAGLKQMLAGKTMSEWIKDQQVETVEQLEQKAYAALANTKYIPAVKTKIVDRLTKFFNDNYAKVNEQEAKRAIKDIVGDRPVVDWIKENGIQNQQDLYDALDNALAGRDIQQRNIDEIKSEFKRILDINNKAETELKNRENRSNAEYRPKKSDLRRLVELYHLGVFGSSHDQLLYDLIGVDSLKQADLRDIEMLAAAASDLSRRVNDVNGYNLTSDAFVARRMQFIQRQIDSIVERNISNKSRLLKVMRAVANYVDLMLTGLLALPITMVQNIFSGARAVLTGVRFNSSKETVVEDNGQFYIETPFGRSKAYATREDAQNDVIDFTGKTKQSFDTYWSMLKEVTATGQAYGEEIGSFATRELFANTLRWKWGEGLLGKGTTIKDKVKSVLFALSLPSRIGLLAFDSANKISLTNKTFYNMIFNSLVARGMQKDEAAQYMNEMLYGQKFKEAKDLARKIIDQNNSLLTPAFRSSSSEAEVTNLANDIVKANLNLEGSIVDTNVLEAALKGSYHVAGLGLGHEPNNPLSRAVKTLRDNMKQQESKLIQEKDWGNLAAHRTKSLVLNGFVLRFIGGATNWLLLRAKEGLGLGILTGAGTLALSKEIDYSNQESLQRQMRQREKARNDIARGIIGLSYTALAYTIGYAVLGGSDDDDEMKLKRLQAKKEKSDNDKKKIEELKLKTSIFRTIKQDIGKDRWFRNMAPDLMLIHYYSDTNEDLLSGTLNYVDRTYNGNDKFSAAQKIKDAITQYKRGDKEGAEGTVMSILGDRFSVPFWRASKEYYRVVTNPFRGDKIPPARYEPATTWDEGLFGGGLLQDLGLYKRDARITMIPGVGPKSYEKFKALKIEKMSDLKDGWWNKEYQGQSILDADEKAKAKKFYQEYKKTK